jgi:uncharacterized membrane protein YfcA
MTFVVIITSAALLTGLTKGGLSPMGALLMPLLSMVMPVSEAIGLMLPLLIVGDVFAVRAYWRTWDMIHIRRLLPAAVIGIVIGLLLLTNLSDEAMRRILGIFTLALAAYKLGSESLKNVTYTPRPWHGIAAGSAAGFASALANAGGPPITSYLLLQKVPPTAFVGTSVLFFAVINLLKLPAFLAGGVTNIDQLIGVLWALPLIPAGVWAGRWLINHINQRLFEWLMLAGLVWAGLTLLLG